MQAQSSSLLYHVGRPSPGHSHNNHSVAYHCSTQRHETGSFAAIQLGSNGRISLFPLGATVCYFFDLDEFPTDIHGLYAAECFEMAIQAWGPIPVRFKRVFAREDAFFSVIGSGDPPDGNTLATAFFPADPAEMLTVKVFPLAFTHHEAMVNIFCHELGHVLGLRHEFAACSEKDDPSVLWGLANPESVMNYYNNPLEMAVHELDIALTNDLYANNGGSFQGFPVDVVSPAPRPG